MSFESIDVPSRVTIMPKIDINCHVCHKYQGQLYPCRICGKVYHPPCIKDIGIKNSSHIIKNASTLIGIRMNTKCLSREIFLNSRMDLSIM